jgi:hypothetical protein
VYFIALNPNTDWGCIELHYIELRQDAQAPSNGRLDADFDFDFNSCFCSDSWAFGAPNFARRPETTNKK